MKSLVKEVFFPLSTFDIFVLFEKTGERKADHCRNVNGILKTILYSFWFCRYPMTMSKNVMGIPSKETKKRYNWTVASITCKPAKSLNTNWLFLFEETNNKGKIVRHR